MENLSTIAEPVSLPIEVPARPDLFDHRFENRPVFPAVEAMEIMAGAVRSFRPRAAIEDMADIRFEKFLAVEKGADTIPVFCRLRAGNRGGIHAELRSRKKFSSGFSRTLVHASVEFSRGGGRRCNP